jgi:hypothetical protein
MKISTPARQMFITFNIGKTLLNLLTTFIIGKYWTICITTSKET